MSLRLLLIAGCISLALAAARPAAAAPVPLLERVARAMTPATAPRLYTTAVSGVRGFAGSGEPLSAFRLGAVQVELQLHADGPVDPAGAERRELLREQLAAAGLAGVPQEEGLAELARRRGGSDAFNCGRWAATLALAVDLEQARGLDLALAGDDFAPAAGCNAAATAAPLPATVREALRGLSAAPAGRLTTLQKGRLRERLRILLTEWP